MKVLVTGSNGFIAKNLICHLESAPKIELLKFNRSDDDDVLYNLIDQASIIFHLAGANRPAHDGEFKSDNIDLTRKIVNRLKDTNKKKKIIFSSSTQSKEQNDYGKSKAEAEILLKKLSKKKNLTTVIYRLTNVFGKWSRPNYNSVVSTFCFNILNSKKLKINDPETVLKLIYIDDLVANFMQQVDVPLVQRASTSIKTYKIKLGELANTIYSFKDLTEHGRVGVGLTRALYSTYISYKEPNQFTSQLIEKKDARGKFFEVIKTNESGQFSFFTTKAGITRGGHYHHTKTEKFLVVKGKAIFRFKHMITGEKFSIQVTEDKPQLVETIPGWAHDITNNGTTEMIALLWANEVFNPLIPDTYTEDL
jgi:UDP-2-acetamido-2,6-beta-L-arabino-hexul-4-ose reductase